MFAQRMRQKESEFYFVSYPAEDILRKVRFVSRCYGERGQAIGGEAPKGKAKDKGDFLVPGAAGPAPNQPLELLAPTKDQNTCAF